MNLGPALVIPDVGDYDAAVAATDGIDRWCTSTDWVLPLSASMRPHDPFVIRTRSGWGVFEQAVDTEGRHIVLGIDRIWGFACPVVGERDSVWHEMGGQLLAREADLVILPGLVEESPTWHAALRGLGRSHRLHRAGGIVRQRADLSDGFDAWFGRRSTRFRQRLRRIRTDADEAGVTIEPVDPTDGPLLDRLISIERISWKGAEHEGLTSADMAGFYRLVLDRLGPSRTRCLVARLDGDDVGYVVGGIRDGTYRGLQISYAETVDDLGVGHLLQLTQIEALCDEGVEVYDLGMDMAYKRRWADESLATTTLAALPH